MICFLNADTENQMLAHYLFYLVLISLLTGSLFAQDMPLFQVLLEAEDWPI